MYKVHYDATTRVKDWRPFLVILIDYLLDQSELTLNLVRSARSNPKLSAYAYIHGTFDFNKTPISPPGTRVLAHDKPEKRPSWGYHGTQGFLLNLRILGRCSN